MDVRLLKWCLIGVTVAVVASGCQPGAGASDEAGAGASSHRRTDVNGADDVSGEGGKRDSATAVPDIRWADETFPDDCVTGQNRDAMIRCVRGRFWQAFQRDFERRAATYDQLTAVIEELEDAEQRSTDELARLYFRRGQLGLAMVLEQEAFDKLGKLTPDFERAVEVKPDYDIVPTWGDSVEIAKAALNRDHDRLAELEERTWRHVDRSPMENLLSISGTTIGLPKSTGYPRETIERLDDWTCEGEHWCSRNTPEAPFARPGLEYHFAEAYARMGDRDQAAKHLNRALDAPGARKWPFRRLAEEARADLDSFVGQYEKLGKEKSGFRKIYANKEYGCMFCHSPREAVPEELRTVE